MTRTSDRSTADSALEAIDDLAVPVLSDAMFALGLPDGAMAPEVRLLAGERILGRAKTIGRVPLPANAGQAEIGPSFGLAIQQVIDELGRGDVLVIAAQGIATHANWGGNMATRANILGASGVVTDGAVRDLREMGPLGMTVFAQGTAPRAGNHALATAVKNGPVLCAGVWVRPGDVIVGDVDGVLVVNPEMAPAIAAKAHELLAMEAHKQAALKSGMPLETAVKQFKIR